MAGNMNIMRSIRVQMKTGYMKSAPEAYTFLRRYPPLNRDTSLPVRKVETRNIPYLHLYEKVQHKNPLYSDEKVYPAYWAHEPQALTLAKKWYEFQQSGMEDKEAYEAAVSYVERLEDDSYTNLKDVLRYMKDRDGASSSEVHYAWLHDDTKIAKIKEFKDKIANASKNILSIEEMDRLFQAQLDYFIQTEILQWNEVERERRMRDPLFVNTFNLLRDHLMGFDAPEIVHERTKKVIKKEIFDRYGTDKPHRLNPFLFNPDDDPPSDIEADTNGESKPSHSWPELESHLGLWRTEKPFYYEDYVAYFNQLRDQPYLGHWEENERIRLSHWIIDTLAYRHGLHNANAHHIQMYLDQLRAHFFPMVRYPKRAGEFSLPSEEEFRRLLYNSKSSL